MIVARSSGPSADSRSSQLLGLPIECLPPGREELGPRQRILAAEVGSNTTTPFISFKSGQIWMRLLQLRGGGDEQPARRRRASGTAPGGRSARSAA